jgi:Protein of unknown function (DUF3455)
LENKIGKYLMNIFKAIAVTGMLVLAAEMGFGQVPAAVEVPRDSRLLLHVYGKGVQVYVCTPAAGDTSRYAWTLAEAKAELYSSDAYRQETGKHYFNAEHHPVWELADGSKVVGSKLRQADAPAADAVPWLLLQAVTAPDGGALKGTTLIQRINTKGGKAPDGGADAAHKGQTIQVPYTAEYLFYTGS